ncbi:MAG: TadE/TadG family type IV pilus assembly protein [Bellilinea sp.]|jgi:hypothetical protein
MKNTKTKSTEKGQSMVELALVLSLVLILLAGVVDLGRMMFEYLSMRDAAQEGGVYGATHPNYCAETSLRVWDNLPTSFSTGNGDAVNITVDGEPCVTAWNIDKNQPTPVHGCNGKELVVILDHNFEMGMPFFAGTIVPMHVEIKDRIVRPACD